MNLLVLISFCGDFAHPVACAHDPERVTVQAPDREHDGEHPEPEPAPRVDPPMPVPRFIFAAPPEPHLTECGLVLGSPLALLA